MPAIICIKGPGGEERDKWLLDLAGEFSSQGLKVGLIRGAGAEKGLSLLGGGLRLERPFDQQPSLMELSERYGGGLDLVISSAHPEDKKVKIAYLPAGADESLTDDPGVKVVVSPAPIEKGLAWFAPQDTAKVAEFAIKNLLPKKDPAWVRVLLNGKRVPIKGFVQDIIGKSIQGMIQTLKGGEKPGRLEIFID